MKKTPYWAVTAMPGESDLAFRNRAGWIYFDAQKEEIDEWWQRLGLSVELRGSRVLEIGCGHGALSVDSLARGATHVYGIDIDPERVRFASQTVLDRFREYRDRLNFSTSLVSELPADLQFDVVLSKDTFEHVEDLPRLLADLAVRLKPGGLLLCGFSPLFHSPWGDHGRYRLKLPWLHTLLPSWLLRTWASWRLDSRVRSPQDLGLNGIDLEEFEACFDPEVWICTQMRVNPINKPLIPLFNRLRRVRPLARYFTIGVYAAFKRRDASAGGTNSR